MGIAKNINLSKLDRKFLNDSMKVPMLSRDEEKKLAEAWVFENDKQAMHKIIKAYSKLVIAFSMKFKNYGLPVNDLVQEGHIGLMQAMAKFEPDRDIRFSTYAAWWIRSAIQDYVLKNWSIVRTGTTASQKALFFNLKKIKQQINDVSRDYMGQKEIDTVSNMLNVKSIEVQNMESRLTGGDLHLNQKFDNESDTDLMSMLPDDRDNPEEVFETFNDASVKKDYINEAIQTLSEREKTIIKLRKLKEKSITLDELGKKLRISKERVRQIETKALEKLQKALLEISQQDKEFFI